MSRFRVCLLAVVLLVPIRVSAGEKAASSELALVPADALGFVHVRLGDVWRSEHFKEWRLTVLKAGKQALAAFDKRFFPTPSSLERVTLFFLPPAGQKDPTPLVIVATSKPIDKEAFVKHTIPGATKEKTPAGTVVIDPKRNTEIFFADDRTFVVGQAGAVQEFLARPKKRDGNLSDALKTAGTGKAVVLAVNAEVLPADVLAKVPPPFAPLVKAKAGIVVLDLDQGGQIDVRLTYADAEKASEAEAAAQQGLKIARSLLANGRMMLERKVLGDGQPGPLDELPEAAASLFGLGVLNRLDEYLASSPLKKDDNALHLSVKIPQGGAGMIAMAPIGVALLLPAVQKVRLAAARTQSMNNLKQIAIAMHSHADANRKFPPAAICDAQGKPLLSWRVAILPYIEQNQLYQQFKLDEPWDSEHNRKLIPQMPRIYDAPASPVDKPNETHYRVFVGGGAGFELAKGLRLPADFTDGTSNTIMVVEAAQTVPWTKPDELVYDAKKPLPKFGNFYRDGAFAAVLFDGSVRMLQSNMPEQTLRAYITRAGGEVINNND